MLLESIKLDNWRCFYGKAQIDFADSSEKNVTLIHAENGVGKTTLLNALLWCFFNRTTKRFEQPDNLLNRQAAKEGRTVASVEVCFEHGGTSYVARRYADIKLPSRQRELRVSTIVNGHESPHPAPDTLINSVMPKDMAGHFLFDGEHAEAISGEENRQRIGDSIRDILGTQLVQCAIEDLEDAGKYYRRQAVSVSKSNSALSDLQNQEESLAKSVAKHKEDIKRAQEAEKIIQVQIEDIQNELRGSQAVKEIQRRRDDLEAALTKRRRHAKDLEDSLIRWLGESGRYVVSKKFENTTFACLDDASTQGKIPAPYDRDFVEGLLARGVCVCGRGLEPHGEHANNVISLLETASSKILQDRVIKVRSRLQVLKRGRGEAPHKLISATRDLSGVLAEIETLEAKLSECSKEISSVSLTDIQKKEGRLQQLRGQARDTVESIGRLNEAIRSCEAQIAEKRRQMNSRARQDESAISFVAAAELAERARDKIKEMLEAEEKSARTVIRKLIAQIIDSTTRKHLVVKLNEDYIVELVDSDGNPMPKSEGENQLLGLAFTAALAQFGALRARAKGIVLLPGTEAPLVLDSPFGKLDSTYKPATAEFLPKMARQVVLLVSKEQGSENVMAAIRPQVGREFILVRHNTGLQGAKKEEAIRLASGAITLTKYGSKFDGTEIVEVHQ
jgi:DNA sulfur modification protein DndD